jgi:nitrogenase molybdenum-iron protein alpha chain
VRCEGFRGVSQSLGHHIANDAIRDHIFEKAATEIETTPYDVTIIGDYNIGGDAWASRESCSRRWGCASSRSGPATRRWPSSPTLRKAKLNLIHCYRSMNYICRHMEDTYGIPWEEYNFFGPTKIYASIRAIAAHFDDTIKENAEALIEKMKPEMDAIIAQYKPRSRARP